MGEVRRGHEFRDDPLHRDMRIAISKALGHAADATRDSMVGMRLVYAADDDRTRHDETDISEMLDLAYPWPVEAPWIRANMVMTVDGRAQAGDGLTDGISSPQDKRVFGHLRAGSDAILVGAGTVRSEGYHAVRPKPGWQERREGEGRLPAPVLAIVSGSLDFDVASDPFTAPAAEDGVQRPVILTTTAADPERRHALSALADVIICGETQVEPHAIVGALVDRGLTRILCEGGPSLLGELIAADAIDELDLTLSPLLLLQRTGSLLDTIRPQPRHLRLAHVIEAGSTLMLRYLVERSDIPTQTSTSHPEAGIG